MSEHTHNFWRTHSLKYISWFFLKSIKPTLNLWWIKEALCNMPGDQQQRHAKFFSPMQQLSIAAASLASLTFISPRVRQRNFQVSSFSVTRLTRLTVSLFLSQSTKKTLPRKMTARSMTAPLELCESKLFSTLCKYLLEFWSNHLFFYCESGTQITTRWNSLDFNVMSPAPSKKKWLKNEASFGKKGCEPCLNWKSSLKSKARQVLFHPQPWSKGVK